MTSEAKNGDYLNGSETTLADLSFSISGEVTRGKHLGSELGFPTANILYDASRRQWPREGVYIAVAKPNGGKRYLAILNQGTHPTAPGGAPTVEAHLIGFPYHELYGKRLDIIYRHYLRPETAFPDLTSLREQLGKDREAALQWAAQNEPELATAAEPNDQPAPRPQEGDRSTMKTPDAPLRLIDVSYRYDPKGEPAVNHVSLDVEKGSFVAVLGHNGSGKSTLAKMMNALFLPSEGQVLVCGLDTAAEGNIWNVRKHAGMVFQNPDNQIVANVVREDVAFGLENLGVPQADMPERIEEALRAVRMNEFADTAPHMLSGGQKQRVAIAGVLAMRPDVMIMDEATAMLDPSGREEVLKTVQKLNRTQGITVVWITHFMEEAAVADRIVVLNRGGIALDGSPREVFSHVAELQALGLDVPPMAELNMRLKAAGLPMPEVALTVSDMVKELKTILCPSK